MQSRRAVYALVAVVAMAALVTTAWALRDKSPATQIPAAPAIADATWTPTLAAPTSFPTPLAQPTPTEPTLVPFPDGVVLYVAHGGYAHGSGGYYSLTRHYRDRKGNIRTDELLKSSDVGGVDLSGIVVNERGEIFVTTCYGEFCGLESGTETNETVVTRSTDGGITWKEIGRAAGSWWARAALDDGMVATNFDGLTPTYRKFPGGQAVIPPVLDIPVGLDPINYRGKLAWISGTKIVDASGSTVVNFLLAEYPGASIRSVLAGEGAPASPADSRSMLTVSWSSETSPGRQQSFVGLFAASGGVPVKVSNTGIGVPVLAGWASVLIVTAEYLRPSTCTVDKFSSGADPAIVDYASWALAFIGTPFYDPNCGQGSQRVVGVAGIAIQRLVIGGGECVNLRSEPSLTGTVLDCLGDGAIISLGKGRSNDGNRSWDLVNGPAGQRGWIADEFIEQP